MQFSRLFLPLIFLSLVACSTTERPLPDEIVDDGDLQRAWFSDREQQSAAVRQLADQADRLIQRGQLPTAEVVLNRALRISNRDASVWSRLAWLAERQGQFQRARDLASRSNSLTSNYELLRFNWQVYRQASIALQDTAAIERAEQALRRLW